MTRSVLQTIFEAGLAAAPGDDSRRPLEPGRTSTTSALSPWLYLTCALCMHTFRIGDIVDMGDSGAQHSEGAGGCPVPQSRHDAHAAGDGGPSAADLQSAFFDGLAIGWPPPIDQPVCRLKAGSLHLASPLGGLSRRTCPVCAHTLRIADEVVICPCSPHAPLCQTAIHRDPAHHLHCWETWNPESKRTHCPITLRKLDP